MCSSRPLRWNSSVALYGQASEGLAAGGSGFQYSGGSRFAHYSSSWAHYHSCWSCHRLLRSRDLPPIAVSRQVHRMLPLMHMIRMRLTQRGEARLRFVFSSKSGGKRRLRQGNRQGYLFNSASYPSIESTAYKPGVDCDAPFSPRKVVRGPASVCSDGLTRNSEARLGGVVQSKIAFM